MRRGFHAVENAGQRVIFYNQEPVRFVLYSFSFKENGSEFFKNSGLLRQ